MKLGGQEGKLVPIPSRCSSWPRCIIPTLPRSFLGACVAGMGWGRPGPTSTLLSYRAGYGNANLGETSTHPQAITLMGLRLPFIKETAPDMGPVQLMHPSKGLPAQSLLRARQRPRPAQQPASLLRQARPLSREAGPCSGPTRLCPSFGSSPF